MGSPEETLAAAEVAATPEGAFEELTGSLQGWKRKISGKKGGTPKKKDVTFVAPDGEEIKNKRQLDKYLKAHPGASIQSSDFEWGVPAGEAVTPTENRRRSARLNSKGRTSTEGGDEGTEPKQPVVKRSRKSRDSGKDESNAAAGKGEPDIKAATEDGGEVPSDNPLDKEKESSEDNGEIKAMDVDVPIVEVPVVEETKEVTSETITDKAEDEKAVAEGIVDTPAELSIKDAIESKVENVQEGIGDVEKPNAESEIPPPQGIHALIGEVPKSQGVEVAPVPEAVI